MKRPVLEMPHLDAGAVRLAAQAAQQAPPRLADLHCSRFNPLHTCLADTIWNA